MDRRSCTVQQEHTAKMTALSGFSHLKRYLDPDRQALMLAAIEDVASKAPFYTPTMPGSGKPLSVRMTNCGPLGWVTDKDRGYRYQATHPITGAPWPTMPEPVLAIWTALSDYPAPPEACLINHYGASARLGSHVDADEEDTSAPVISVSLGDDAVFHIGGRKRADPKQRLDLRSGDVVMLGGAARLAYHGIDRVIPGTSDLIRGGGRINLTLRRVTRPAHAIAMRSA
jgi:alkylated DNA repair protein (DNA oxidative demethylase)